MNALGAELILTNSAPFLFQKFTESENVNINNFKGVNQDGLTYLNNTLDLKDITIEFIIIAIAEAEMIAYRNNVLKILNPKLGEGYLVYKDDIKERRIKCIVNKLPFFNSLNIRGWDSQVSLGLIYLTANNPYWLDNIITSEQITTWIGGMNFPLTMPTAFAMAGEKKINIINIGDAETPLEITIIGPCTNPKIANLTTGEYIKINKILLAGESLIITTNFGNKRIELDGVNVFNYIDLNSTLFSLQIGDNIIEVTNDDINENSTVKINYQNRYLGV